MFRKLCGFFCPSSLAEWIVYVTVIPVAATLFYWALIDVEPVDSNTLQFEIVNPVVRQGEVFTINYKVTWNRDCRITAFRFVVDSVGQRYQMNPDERYVNAGYDEFPISIPIPLAATPGPAHYRATIIYECNPWQRFIAPLEREIEQREFTIIPGEPTAGGLSSLSPFVQAARDDICPVDRPVFVRSYCRAAPQMTQRAED